MHNIHVNRLSVIGHASGQRRLLVAKLLGSQVICRFLTRRRLSTPIPALLKGQLHSPPSEHLPSTLQKFGGLAPLPRLSGFSSHYVEFLFQAVLKRSSLHSAPIQT